MATIDDHLYSRLANYAGLAALVGTRIDPGILNQGDALPAVTFRKISGPRIHQMGSDPGLVEARYEVNCWGDAEDNADGFGDIAAVGAQVVLALSRYSGTISSVVVDQVFLDDEEDLYEPSTKTWRRILDFIVHYRE
jgi:hypothetical protein